MNRPPKVVGLVTPWVAYADELEAKLAEANARPDYSYEDTTRLAELRALAQAVVDGTKSNDYGVTLGIAIDALAAALEEGGE